MRVVNDLRSCGMKDILIACMDELTGFSEAVRAMFPHTRVQLCIVYMIRNSTNYVSYKDLKRVYGNLCEYFTYASEIRRADIYDQCD
jgi:transposase-like protein